MLIRDAIGNLCNAALLGLTPGEKWAAARGGSAPVAREYSFILLFGALLLFLVLLLWWVSHRQAGRRADMARELFSDSAAPRRLNARERQVLQAITDRGRLRDNQDIFGRADAFDEGAAALLAECRRSRTPLETDLLKKEVSRLREKIGYNHDVSRPVLARSEPARVAQQEGPTLSAINAPATVTRFPLIRTDVTDSPEARPADWFEMVHAVVTEASGASVQVRSALDARIGERVLVVFSLSVPADGAETTDPAPPTHVVAHLGRVRQRQVSNGDALMTVDWIGLKDEEKAELQRLASRATFQAGEPRTEPASLAAAEPDATRGV